MIDVVSAAGDAVAAVELRESGAPPTAAAERPAGGGRPAAGGRQAAHAADRHLPPRGRGVRQRGARLRVAPVRSRHVHDARSPLHQPHQPHRRHDDAAAGRRRHRAAGVACRLVDF